MKKPEFNTVTVGIPARNEEANILYLLKSILRQKGDDFVIEKIYVLCDGCTDSTAEKVRIFSQKHSLIVVIDDGERKGKVGRLNQLYKMNESNIVFSFDGDVVLKGNRVIERMVEAFEAENVVLVSGNNQPVRAETLIEKIYNSGFKMWYEIRKDYRGGDSVRNLHGCAVALRSSFAKSFNYPLTLLSGDGGYVFMVARIQKKGFRFVKEAVVLFRSVSNLQDFFLQATRNLDNNNNVAKYFGKRAYKEFSISRKYKLKGIIKMLFIDPIFTTLAIILSFSLRVFPKKHLRPKNDAKWDMVKSTKRAINI